MSSKLSLSPRDIGESTLERAIDSFQQQGVDEKTPEQLQIRFTYHYLFAFSMLLGAFLRFYGIGSEPFWLDEAWSYWFSSRTMIELWTIIPKWETNPPFYYTILKVWMNLLGSSEPSLRSLSAAMSIGCIPIVFMIGRLLGKSIGGEWVGAIAALMFSVSPVHIQYAQEARTYAMLTFAATLTLYSFLWIMTHPAAACEPMIRKVFGLRQYSKAGCIWSESSPWIIATVAVTFTLWLHNTSILYILTLFLILFAWFLFQLKGDKTFFSNIMAVVVISSLLWGPYLIFLIPQVMNANFAIAIPKLTALSTINTIAWLLMGHSISWTTSLNEILKIVIFLLLIILAVTGLLNIWRQSGKYVSILIVGSILGPILMELAVSIAFNPIFLARTIIYVSVPFYIAIAAGILMVRGPRKRALVIVIITLISLKWSYGYYANNEKSQKEPWDKIAQTVTKQAKENDVVLLVPNYIEIPFSYYAKRTNNIDFQVTPFPYPMANFLSITRAVKKRSGAGADDLRIRPFDIPAINNAVQSNSVVWLITRREDLFDPDRIVLNALMQKRHLISIRPFGEINVFQLY
jgi:uncharacterized membrane protein